MSSSQSQPTALTIPFVEFVALSACLTALTALSIDIMLPALPSIAAEFSRTNTNDRQLVVIAYFLGFGVSQLFWGPISDRFGRIPVLAIGLIIFISGTLIALVAGSFDALLAARTTQGVGSAAARVTVTAVARDLFSGAQMSRVMSLIMTVFILVPIVAPIIGQGLLYFGSWRLHFFVILTAGIIALLWSWVRLPETRPRDRRSAGLGRFGQAIAAFAREHASLAYMLACGMIFGCLTVLIANSQQIFGELYGLGEGFAFAFGAVALAMAAAAMTNARIVLRRGTRVVCHSALVAFVTLSILLTILTCLTAPPLYIFLPWVAALFYLFGLITPNFNAITLEPMGEIAGLAASVLGFTTTLLAALGGWIIGQAYDGSVVPFAVGFAVLSSAALLLVFLAEGREGMFSNRNGGHR